MKKGFTLAETLIVLVILGIIAAITIPALVRRQVEASNRTKIKKAMAVYDTTINKMVVENGIKSNDTFYSETQKAGVFAIKNNCTNTSAYFKIAQTLSDDNGTNCRFKASDGLYWDISNITKPIVAVKEEFLNTETADGNTNNAFYLRAWFDANGSLRVDDLQAIENYSLASENDKENLAKLYDYINGKSTTSSSENKVMTPRNKFYDLYLNNSFEPCGYTHEECVADLSLCKTCSVTGDGYVAYYVDNELIGFSYPDSSGTELLSLVNGTLPRFNVSTEFYNDGKIKKQSMHDSYVYVDAKGRRRATSATFTYYYTEDGDVTCETSSVREGAPSCIDKCGDFIYKCPAN